jgi:hypothetical protein
MVHRLTTRSTSSLRRAPTVRRRLEAQGFCGLDDATLEEVGPWLRWSPALCTLFMTAGVGLDSPLIQLWRAASHRYSAPATSRAPAPVRLRHRYGLAGSHRLGISGWGHHTGIRAWNTADPGGGARERHTLLHPVPHLQHALQAESHGVSECLAMESRGYTRFAASPIANSLSLRSPATRLQFRQRRKL